MKLIDLTIKDLVEGFFSVRACENGLEWDLANPPISFSEDGRSVLAFACNGDPVLYSIPEILNDLYSWNIACRVWSETETDSANSQPPRADWPIVL